MNDIKFFGMASEKAGCESIEMPVSGMTVKECTTQLLEKFPALQSIPFRLAVDKQLADDELRIPQHVEIAVLPPFAGG